MCERFSVPVQTGSGAHLITYAMGTGSFPGVKRPGLVLVHPPISGIEIKEILCPYIYCPSGPVLWWTLPKIFKVFLCSLSRYFMYLGLQKKNRFIDIVYFTIWRFILSSLALFHLPILVLHLKQKHEGQRLFLSATYKPSATCTWVVLPLCRVLTLWYQEVTLWHPKVGQWPQPFKS